jgi:hypothetical protein
MQVPLGAWQSSWAERSHPMDAETYGNVVLPIRSKARKAYDQANAHKGTPKALLATLLTAKLAAEAWADRVNPYQTEDKPSNDSQDDSDSDADTGKRIEVEPVKAKAPTVRKASTRIEAR